jgi:hypothetical protein
MKKIKTTDITSTSAMPLKKGSLDHLQAAYTETIQDVNKAYWAGDRASTQPKALYGLENTGSGSTYIISAGALMLTSYGEVFRCDAQTVVVSGSNVLVGTVTTTYLTAADADPVEFSDSTSNNVHEIRKIVWSSGASGSGNLNYTSLVFRNSFDDIVSYTLAGDLNAWTIGTGSVSLRLLIEGKKATLFFDINNTTTAAANNMLIVDMSTLGGVFKQSSFTLGYFNVAATSEWVLVEAVAATSTITFTRIGSAFGTYTNELDIKGQIIGELA